ncbi:hypothetical protein CDAR_482961 [Caerostris darwini]|uniref:Uncharacterized protein n=1 Tax=Caerostris darwini TaxID=1538125 RepID=A0AAV4MR82_9ARAC|nr:hypothetical protein CDAR_482961 [Caerostris darwini]
MQMLKALLRGFILESLPLRGSAGKKSSAGAHIKECILGTWMEKEFAREKEGIMACTECGSSKRDAVIGRGRKERRRNLLPERKEWEKPFKQKDSSC